MSCSVVTPAKYKKTCLYILALGGTISSLSSDATGQFYSTPSCPIKDVIASLPINSDQITLLHEQFFQKISNDISYNDLINIAKKINSLVKDEKIDGLVIVQGTNTMEEVAYFINLVIHTTKNIVFTGAFRPSNALGSDGARNLYNAILLASSPKLTGMGVVLTFNDTIVRAQDALKGNPCLLGDFSATEFGKIGIVQGNEIQILKNFYSNKNEIFHIENITHLPQVYVIYGHLGVSADYIELAIKQKIKGIISAGFGKGYQSDMVTEALIKASQQGIMVVRCSRTGFGMINCEPGYDDKHGFITAGALTPQKASILLSLILTKTDKRIEVQEIFNQC